MGLFEDIGRGFTGAFTLGLSEAARAVAKGAGAGRLVTTIEGTIGRAVATGGFTPAAAAGIIAAGSVQGRGGSAQRVTNANVRVNIVRNPPPSSVPIVSGGGGAAAFRGFSPFEPTGGNPAWRSSGLSDQPFRPGSALSVCSGGEWVQSRTSVRLSCPRR